MSFIIKGAAYINTSIAGNIQPEIPTFTPSDLGTKLTLWLDERDQTTTVISGNSYLSFWGDQQTSTGPHDMTNVAGAAGPIPGLTINGYAAPEFRRTTPLSNPTRMVLTGAYKLQSLVSSSAYHVFSVANISDIQQNNPTGGSNEGIIYSDSAFWYPMSFKNNGGSPQMTVGHYRTSPNTGFETLTVSGLPLNTPVLLETWFDGTNLNCCIANGSVATQAAALLDPFGLPFGIVSLGIGNQHMSGSVATVLVCNQALDGTERANVRQYLGNKYGVSY